MAPAAWMNEQRLHDSIERARDHFANAVFVEDKPTTKPQCASCGIEMIEGAPGDICWDCEEQPPASPVGR